MVVAQQLKPALFWTWTTAQRAAQENVPQGLTIRNSDTNTLQYYDGLTWYDLEVRTNLVATVAPTVTDDNSWERNYSPGSVWVDVTADKAYICVDATEGAAVWREVDVVAHEAAADPHTGYQKKSEKDAASGYAGLTAGTKLNLAQMQEVMAYADLTDQADASGVTYTPAVATDWDGDADPGDLDDALNQLAERTDDLEAAPPAHVHDAADVTYTPAVLTDWDGDADPGDADNALDQLAERVDDLEGGAGHAAVTLAADAETVLNLSTQEIGLVAKGANTIFAGPVNGADADPAFRSLVAADIPDVSATYVPKALFDAQSILAATADNTPAAVTVAEQTVVARLTGGNIDDVAIGIADDNILQVDQYDAADNDYAKFTAAGLEGRSYAEVKADLDLEAGTDFPALATFNDHSARHEDGGADEISLTGLVGELRYLFFHIDGGGAEIADGIAAEIGDMPACTVEGWTLVGSPSGSLVLDLWSDSYANHPPTVADTMIATGTKPTISASTKGQDLTVDWADVTIAAGATLTINVDSATTIEKATLTLRLRMT